MLLRMVCVWKSAKYVSLLSRDRSVVANVRPSSVLFVRRLTFIFRRVMEGVLSVFPTLYIMKKRQNWIGNQLTENAQLLANCHSYIYEYCRVGNTEYTCCVVCGGGRRELLFDKFFEHLLQYIDRKVEKVIAQPPKRRMPPRSPLRNYLELVVVDKYILIKKARKKWAWQDASRVTFSVTIGSII